jgi:hypothetical protein
MAETISKSSMIANGMAQSMSECMAECTCTVAAA